MPALPALVIFDCDGVLVDSERIANAVMVAHMAQAGWSITEAESRKRFIGKRMVDVTTAIEANTGRKLADSWLADFEAARDIAFTTQLKPVAGITDVLHRLKTAGIPFCVASSGSHAKMRHSLGLTGLLPLLEDHLFSATEVARGKPHPDIFLHAAARMGHASSDCVVVEDTPTGAAAAKAAGMRCFGYAADSDAATLIAYGAICFTAMAELPGLFGLN